MHRMQTISKEVHKKSDEISLAITTKNDQRAEKNGRRI